MSTEESTANALAIGRKKADQILARRRLARARREDALSRHSSRLELRLSTSTAEDQVSEAVFQSAGFLVAAGDSWFDYPIWDVLKCLEDNYGYNVESAAQAGDPIEAMAYQGGQLDEFARCLERVLAHGVKPKAILLSGGGDDIAGKEFGMLLNNATSSISGWNPEIVDGVVSERISTAYKSMLTSINVVCEQYMKVTLPIFVHGYDYPVPDGRGFGGGWPLSGPWLEPGFREKLFTRLERNTDLLRNLINRFNEMLVKLVKEPTFQNLVYVDLRGTLSTDLVNEQYKDWWANELHPTEKGFDAVTAKFAAELNKI
jgi:hypothetical protein